MTGLNRTFFLLTALISLTRAAVYRPVCSSYQNPPPGGWKKWSDRSTWSKGRIPGVNGNKGYVTIPCNVGIILDISVTVQQIVINGTLKVEGRGPYVVNTNFVIVQGKLLIGSEDKPYNGKVTFNLTYGRYTYGWNRREGSNNAGIKAFIVLGGQVVMNGMYGNQKSWTTLATTARKGATSISVSGDVSAWPVGGSVAIASTDYDYTQAETRTIRSVKRSGTRTVLTLTRALTYMHWGSPIQTGLKGVTMSQSAEVALLDRSIVIRGAPTSDSYLGGHFVVFETPAVQKIVGVEFVNMGQQGRQGRYPVYFRLCGNVKGSVVRKVSVHKSQQRCVVVHGSWNARIDSNVAYDTKGHCYHLEDGIEYGNVFLNNLGFSTRRVSRLIVNQTNAIESDNFPATFYISNPRNSYVGNVAAGSESSGFWFQLNDEVRGPSRQNPLSEGVYPRLLSLGTFSANSAHSNARSGLSFYPGGYRPRNYQKNSNNNPVATDPVPAIIANFRAYKNAKQGVLVNMSDSITFSGGFFADNRVNAIEVHLAEHIIVRNAIILGETTNVGNPTDCDKPNNQFASCEPLVGCALPVSASRARSLGLSTLQGPSVPRTVPLCGVWLSQAQYPPRGALTDSPSLTTASLPNKIQNVTFAFFSNRCKPSAAITANGAPRQMFLASHSSRRLRFPDSSPRVYLAPRGKALSGYSSYVDGGTVPLFFVFWDEDGTLVQKSGGGYAVADTKAILPAGYVTGACTGVVRGSYGWLCPGTCYRTVLLDMGKGSRPLIEVRNPQNRETLSVRGSALTSLNLRTGYAQVLSFTPAPEYIQVSFADPEGCRKDLSLGFRAPSGYHWFLALVQDIRPCEGKDTDPACVIDYGVICSNADVFRLLIGGKTRSNVVLRLMKGRYDGC